MFPSEPVFVASPDAKDEDDGKSMNWELISDL